MKSELPGQRCRQELIGVGRKFGHDIAIRDSQFARLIADNDGSYQQLMCGAA